MFVPWSILATQWCLFFTFPWNLERCLPYWRMGHYRNTSITLLKKRGKAQKPGICYLCYFGKKVAKQYQCFSHLTMTMTFYKIFSRTSVTKVDVVRIHELLNKRNGVGHFGHFCGWNARLCIKNPADAKWHLNSCSAMVQSELQAWRWWMLLIHLVSASLHLASSKCLVPSFSGEGHLSVFL